MGWLFVVQAPVKARLSGRVKTRFKTHTSTCKLGTGFFPGVKRPGCGVNHPLSPSAEVIAMGEKYLQSVSVCAFVTSEWLNNLHHAQQLLAYY
jgi:hypothetical protein